MSGSGSSKQYSGSSGWFSLVIPDWWKQPFWRSVTDEGISIYVNDMQLKNASSPIEMTDEGIEIDVNDVQWPKHCFPIDETDDGMTTDDNELHSKKAYREISESDDGTLIHFNEKQW